MNTALRTPLRGVTALASGLAIAMTAPGPADAGSAPVLSWTPATSTATYDYGTVAVGTESVQTFTLRNRGGSRTSALKITLFSDSGEFTIVGNTCTGTRLRPRKTCTVMVQYAPNTAGQTDTATLKGVSREPTVRARHTLTGWAEPYGRSHFQSTCSQLGGDFVLTSIDTCTTPEGFPFSEAAIDALAWACQDAGGVVRLAEPDVVACDFESTDIQYRLGEQHLISDDGWGFRVCANEIRWTGLPPSTEYYYRATFSSGIVDDFEGIISARGEGSVYFNEPAGLSWTIQAYSDADRLVPVGEPSQTFTSRCLQGT